MKNIVKRVLFLGSKKQGLLVLKKIYELSPETLIGIVTIDDRSYTRSMLSEFKLFSKKNSLSLFIAQNKKESEDFIIKVKPDLCMVVGWYWLITQQVLNFVPNGFIGIHNSFLPLFRGGSPLVWAIISGEKKIGFSFFSFTEKIDDGDVWIQEGGRYRKR